jgi:hypothetical protein
MNMGTGALGRINDWYGISGNANPERAMEEFRNSPDYQVAQREGVNALQNSAALRGGLLGGRFGRSVQEFGADLGARQFGSYRGFMAGLANSGQQAATSLGGFGVNLGAQGIQADANLGAQGIQTGANMGNLLNSSGQYQGNAIMGAGQAQASGTVGSANALTSGFNNAQNNLMLWNMMNRPGGATPVGSGGGGGALGAYNYGGTAVPFFGA